MSCSDTQRPAASKLHSYKAAAAAAAPTKQAHVCYAAVLLQCFQDTTTFMEQAKASHDQAVAKLTKSHKDATTQINRSAAAAPYHP